MAAGVRETAGTGPCHSCQIPATLQCQRCKQVFYCSVVCQKEGWKKHKPFCRPAVSPLDPADFLTKYASAIGPEWVKEAFSHIDPNQTVYSVGSGNGALEQIAVTEGFRKVICIDPDTKGLYDRDAPSRHVFIPPTYDDLKQIPHIEPNSTLFLIAPPPEEVDSPDYFDAQALDRMIESNCRSILLVVETNNLGKGSSGSPSVQRWVKQAMEGKKPNGYGVKFLATTEYIPNIPDPKQIFTDHYVCLLAEKGFTKKPIVKKKAGIVDTDPALLEEWTQKLFPGTQPKKQIVTKGKK